MTPTPSPLVAGIPATLDIQIISPSGAAVTSFAELHTQTMHVVAVSQDVEELRHVHPMLQPGGHLMVDTTFSLAQPYKLFLEYQPQGAPDEVLTTAMVTPAGAKPASPRWDVAMAFSGSVAMELTTDNTYVRLMTAPNAKNLIQAGVTAHIMIEVRNADMTPANVEDWLGMPAHAIVVSGDLGTFFHLHALRGGSGTMSMPGMSMPGSSMPGMSMPTTTGTTMPPMEGMPDPMYAGPTTDDLTYDLKLPAPGLYKVFFQFQRAGRVITAPFLVYGAP